MRHLFATAAVVAALSCAREPTPAPAPTNPPAVVPDVACGTAVVDQPGGKLSPRRRFFWGMSLIEKWFQLQPQIINWEPAKWRSPRIRIAFLDGDAASRALVMTVAKEWLPGLKLSFTESTDTTGDVRITFTGNGVWSKIGQTADTVPDGEPTMGLAGVLQSRNADVRRAYILHEFGHALGALHEHQRHDAPLTWKTDAVYAYYARMYGWSEAQVDKEVILPLQESSTIASPQFDRFSVMMYPILEGFTKEGFVQPWNSKITEVDRRTMAEFYK